MSGIIREVSLVYGGANPGAYIDHAVLAHDDGTYSNSENEAHIMLGGLIEDSFIEHADKEQEHMAEETTKKKEEDLTVGDVLDSLTEDQKKVVAYLLEEAKKEGAEDTVKHSDDEGDEYMSYNAFENENPQTRPNYLSHSDQGEIIGLAKDSTCGSFKKAMKIYAEENGLLHGDDDDVNMIAGGFEDTTPLYPTMSNNPADAAYTSFTAMLPEFRDVRGGMPPELLTLDQGWISLVMNKVQKLPFSRIRTAQTDIRDVETREQLRARGYQKGNKKKNTGLIKIARRTTEPHTIYVKNELHRDDIVDITDFDYVNYLYRIDEMMLKEELSQAILFGDGRDDADEDKIPEDHIRPIWTDDELYTRHIELDMERARQELQGTNTSGYFGENYIYAEAMVNTLLYGREDHLGTGTPDLFITQHMMNLMLLARDMNGRRIYSNRAELATALNVGNIITAKQFENRIRTDDNGQQWKMIAILVNLSDYAVGHTRGGEVTHFTQFDIDFNKQKSLIETRLSGALTRIQSAMVIEEKVTSGSGSGSGSGNGSGTGTNP
jgi:hypothetical protein